MKSKSSSNNIYNMEGLSKVFSFTLKQTFKNKGYLISYIMVIAMMTLMSPISALSAKSTESTMAVVDSMKQENDVTKVFIDNETDVNLSLEDLGLKDTSFENKEVVFEDVPDLKDTEIGVVLKLDESERYKTFGIVSDDSKVSSLLLDSFTEHIYNAFEDKRILSSISEEDYSDYLAGIEKGKAITEKEYYELQNSKFTSSDTITLSTVYSVIVMMLVSLTVSFVISAVMEEKTSKLVENLLVSVRPLALIMGKIFAMMIYVVSMLVFGSLGSGISGAVMGLFMVNESEAVAHATTGYEFGAIFGLSFGKILILILSVLLTYLIFSILAGLFGSACTKAEEVGPTVMAIQFISIAGYIITIFIPLIDNKVVTNILAVVPFISSYVAPINFVCEKIPFWLYAISLLVQILLAVSLFMITAKVYRKLIVNDSKKLSFIEVLKLAGKGEQTNV